MSKRSLKEALDIAKVKDRQPRMYEEFLRFVFENYNLESSEVNIRMTGEQVTIELKNRATDHIRIRWGRQAVIMEHLGHSWEKPIVFRDRIPDEATLEDLEFLREYVFVRITWSGRVEIPAAKTPWEELTRHGGKGEFPAWFQKAPESWPTYKPDVFMWPNIFDDLLEWPDKYSFQPSMPGRPGGYFDPEPTEIWKPLLERRDGAAGSASLRGWNPNPLDETDWPEEIAQDNGEFYLEALVEWFDDVLVISTDQETVYLDSSNYYNSEELEKILEMHDQLRLHPEKQDAILLTYRLQGVRDDWDHMPQSIQQMYVGELEEIYKINGWGLLIKNFSLIWSDLEIFENRQDAYDRIAELYYDNG